jgi:SAM-dependent methyltransferase
MRKKVRQESSQLSWMTCDFCDLIFAGQRPTDQNIESWYLELFKTSEERNYDSFPLPTEYVEGKKQSGADLFAKLNQQGLIPHSSRVLHIRCATGEFLRLAQNERACKVTGLDFFPSSVRHANDALGTNAVFQMRGPQPENPFPDEQYDLIVSNHMVTHAHDPAALMTNFRKWLKDDGVLVLMNEPDHALSLKSWKSYPRGLNFFHKQMFTASTFKSSLAGWGFGA